MTRSATLRNVAEFINGVAFKPDDWQAQGRRIIRIQNLTDPNKPFNRTLREVEDKYHVHPGDLLVSWSASLGVFEWPGSDVGLLNQHIFRVVPNEAVVDKRYLRHVLETALEDMRRHLHGATMQHVNREEFLATRIFLPPISEQQRIAAILDKSEDLRAKRNASLNKIESLTKLIFFDLFGDPNTNPNGWPKVAIGDVAGIIVPTRDKPKRFVGDIPWITLPDLSGFFVSEGRNLLTAHDAEEVGNRLIPKNSVLLSCAGTLGRVAVTTCPVYANQQFYGLIPQKVFLCLRLLPEPGVLQPESRDHRGCERGVAR